VVNIIQASYTKVDKIVSIVLLLAIFVLLIIGIVQEKPIVIDEDALKVDVNFPEVEERVIEDFFDYSCSELEGEFGKIGTPYERDMLITNVMLLKRCDITKPCISDAKFEFIMEQFNKGIISSEEFSRFNDEFRSCA